MLTPCMGGWCRIREQCPHYTEAKRGPDDADRLCLPGQDGARDGWALVIRRPVGSWERSGARWMRHAHPFDLLGAA